MMAIFCPDDLGLAVVLVVDGDGHVSCSFAVLPFIAVCRPPGRRPPEWLRLGAGCPVGREALRVVAAAHGDHAGARELADAVGAEEVLHGVQLCWRRRWPRW